MLEFKCDSDKINWKCISFASKAVNVLPLRITAPASNEISIFPSHSNYTKSPFEKSNTHTFLCNEIKITQLNVTSLCIILSSLDFYSHVEKHFSCCFTHMQSHSHTHTEDFHLVRSLSFECKGFQTQQQWWHDCVFVRLFSILLSIHKQWVADTLS